MEHLKFQLAELKRMIFGAKRERFVPTDINQGSLFDLPVPEVELESNQEINYTRNKPSSKKQALRLELAPHLPRREEVIEPDDLPQDAIKIGQAVTEILEYEPATIYVRKIVRPKYIASSTDEQTIITIADLPSLPIPKGNAGAGILAHILVSKFVDHLPFYRQVKMFKRQDVNIAESTINGWFNATCNLLSPLYDALKNKLLSANYIMADETPIGVLTKDKPGATHKGYHWVYYDPVKKLVLFDYQKTRSREGPDKMLENYSGYLQTDGYVAYKNLKNQKNITLLACMAHARRKFEHAKDNDPQRAKQALLMFQQLYDIERIAREDQLSYDEIKQLRQKESLPVLNQMENWLKENINQVLPKSAIGGAIAYTLKLWPRLIRYVENGQFQIDNNLIENSIRPVALGRKNYLFAGSHNAAQQAAIIYSLLATCKINQIEPFSWLKNTLNVIPDYPANQLDKLLPGKE
ncbi:MAG: IS66 family transposase [Bacteroidetes bacterium]|nr:MAG: IS66 family transposase [Bacteroidota bacterium]